MHQGLCDRYDLSVLGNLGSDASAVPDVMFSSTFGYPRCAFSHASARFRESTSAGPPLLKA